METLTQLTLNTLIRAAGILLFVAGILLVYRVSRIINFSFAGLFACGAFFAYYLTNHIILPILIAGMLAIVLTSTIGCSTEYWAFRILRNRDASPLVMLLASLGLYIGLVGILALVFGEDSKTLRSQVIGEGVSIFGGRATSTQILTIVLAGITAICLPLLRKHTTIGKAASAVASDADLSSGAGISLNRIRLYVTALASGLAALAGILAGFDINITPTMGMNVLMAGLAALVIGGGTSVGGLCLAAILVGITQNMAVFFIGVQWSDPITFLLLIIFLVVRPRGFLGSKDVKATV